MIISCEHLFGHTHKLVFSVKHIRSSDKANGEGPMLKTAYG